MIMDRRYALKALAGLSLCPLCAAAGRAEETHGPHWSYEGATGPDKWGGLDAANAVCGTGAQQSPIDLGLAEPIPARQPRLQIGWTKRPETIVNNGHTIQLNFGAGGNTLKLGKLNYDLTQFHFHHPSEHLLNGKASAMEAHFVHAAEGGGLAVVGVLMTPGRSNAAFAKVMSTAPSEEGSPIPADGAIDPNGLLPARWAYYRYEGSLTTPPCSETVNWLVMAESAEVAAADIARFAKLYPMNARPVQNLNRRFILKAT